MLQWSVMESTMPQPWHWLMLVLRWVLGAMLLLSLQTLFFCETI